MKASTQLGKLLIFMQNQFHYIYKTSCIVLSWVRNKTGRVQVNQAGPLLANRLPLLGSNYNEND